MITVSRRTKILGIISIVVLVAVGVFIAFRPAINSFIEDTFAGNTDPIPGTPVQGTPISSKSQKLYNSAVDAAVSGGPEAGQKVLDDELAKVTDKSDKANIYAQKATLASSPEGGSNTDQALDFAYEAETQSPDYGTALLIAEMEYYTGDKSIALTYYKLYLERLTPEAIELNPGDKEAYEQRVQELEQSL